MKTLIYAWRFLTRAKSYTIINLIGLSFSLACCIVLTRYLHQEQTVDTHCIDREHVYGVKNIVMGNAYQGQVVNQQDSVWIDPTCIEHYTQVIPLNQDYVLEGNHRFAARVIVTDSVFLQLFHYPLVQGESSLAAPNSALLMKDFATRVFGENTNPVGKVLRYSNGKDVIVEGVLDRPSNKTSLNFDLILSQRLSDDNAWNRMGLEFYTFFPGTDMNHLAEIGRIPRYVNPPQYDSRKFTFEFIPVEDIYWDRSMQHDETDMFVIGNRFYFWILWGVCMLLLLAGVLNFINIYLITMLRRGREYGLKKVFGARGSHLFRQIWTENFLLVGSALFIAWVLVELSHPWMNRLFGDTISYSPFDLWLSVVLLVFLPVLASIYPYLKYTLASPLVSIRSVNMGRQSIRSRMIFLCIQYVLTFLLVLLSFYFNGQLNLMLETNPGFRTKDIVIARLVYESNDYSSYTPESIRQRQQRVKALDDKMNACPDIEAWEASFADILNGDYEGVFINGQGEKMKLTMRMASPHFFEVYDIGFVEGALPDMSEDRGLFSAVVLNQSALKAMGYESCRDAVIKEETPMATRGLGNSSLSVSAVVKDYYGGHLSLGKKPTVYFVGNSMSGDVYQIACVPGKLDKVLEYLRKTEQEIYGSEDFEYQILEENIRKIYDTDRRVASVYTLFAAIAVLVSSLGLFGISLFDIRQRYREIGIRKVNGAQKKDLYRLLFRKYLWLLGVAFIIAIPVAITFIYRYTENFAVKAPLSIGIFLLAIAIVAVISMGTLFWQVNRAARINPAEVIKRE